MTPALDGFRVSLQETQSQTECVVTSSLILVRLKICIHCVSRFKYLTSLSCVWIDIRWHSSLTMNVMSARVLD